jgi:hypothetical protein
MESAMKIHRGKLIAFGLSLTLGVMLPAPWWTARLRANPPAQGGPSVRLAPVGKRLAGKPGEKGATYYALEAQATRLTMRFADAVAVAERTFDGDLVTKLNDVYGNELARFKADRIDGANDVLQYTGRAGKVLQVFSDPRVRPTLDWANHQTYSLWKDRIDADATTLEWRDTLIRRKGATTRDLHKEVLELQTDWANGMSAKTVRKPAVNRDLIAGRTLQGQVFVSRLTRDGAELGIVNWFPENQVLIWDLPGLTKGYIAPEHLKDYGGWPFAPDMAWLNLQASAFHHYKTQIQQKGFVAKHQPGWPARILQFMAPSVSADEPGCDYLHWLDGTVFRFCCDVHDLCYSANGCSSKSWWQVWTSWRCDACNAFAIDCFLRGGIEGSLRGIEK